VQWWNGSSPGAGEIGPDVEVAAMDDVKEAVDPQADFVHAWRLSWRTLRQQRPVLRVLYQEVVANSLSPAMLEVFRGPVQEMWKRLDMGETAIGARDAYATAVVMVVDDLLKRAFGAYKAVPGAPLPLTVGCNGVDMPTVFRVAGNNVRHYQGWVEPLTSGAPGNICKLAKLLGHPQLDREYYSNYAANLAWMVLVTVGGDSYDAFEERVRASLDEMIDKLDLRSNVLIRHELNLP